MKIILKASRDELDRVRNSILIALSFCDIDSRDVENILEHGGYGYNWSLDVYENEDDGDIVFELDIGDHYVDKGINAMENLIKNPLSVKIISKAVKNIRKEIS